MANYLLYKTNTRGRTQILGTFADDYHRALHQFCLHAGSVLDPNQDAMSFTIVDTDQNNKPMANVVRALLVSDKTMY